MNKKMDSHSIQWPETIRQINDLPEAEKLAIYRTLVPDWVFHQFNIDPIRFTVEGNQVIQIRCPTGSHSVEITVFHKPNTQDPALYLQMGDTFNNQLAVLMVVVNDPESPRFDVDIDDTGVPNQYGTTGNRNIHEELRAMRAGLCPGQIRRGMRIFRTAIPLFEDFVKAMGHDAFYIEPLFYHNAITFERYGFAYSRGLRIMKNIHEDFLPGGELHTKLNRHNPFRSPDAWKTVSGRSWAIHDGILDKSFTGVHMYKRIGHAASICTFPNAPW